MREESQKSKQAKMVEDLEKAKHIVEDCKRILSEKKKQVDVWKNRVDRSCIERIRAFQNPPALIGQIMEMILVLIGRKKFPDNVFIFRSDPSASQSVGSAKDRDDKTSSNSENIKQSKSSPIFICLFFI